MAVLNCNPAFQPLMQEAALHCTNPNVFFSWKPWSPGALQALNHGSNQPIRCGAGLGRMCAHTAARPASRHLALDANVRASPHTLLQLQPCARRQLLRSRSMAMVNVHCPKADPLMKPRPALAALHKWRLLARRRHFVAGAHTLPARHAPRPLHALPLHAILRGPCHSSTQHAAAAAAVLQTSPHGPCSVRCWQQRPGQPSCPSRARCWARRGSCSCWWCWICRTARRCGAPQQHTALEACPRVACLGP